MKSACIPFLLAALALALTTATVQASPPNVVFILADDLGYGDLKCYGHPYSRTPNLDRLAAEGTRFTQCYVTGITCCPSRTGFMTGKFPATYQKYPAASGFGSRITVTELLRKEGYHTGHFGKWHMGPTPKPGTYGIDELNPADQDVAVRRNTDPRGRDAHIFDEAIAFLEKNQAGPFYLNVWGHITHFPVSPPRAFAEAFQDVTVNEGDFAASMGPRFEAVRKQGADVNECMRRYLGELQSLDVAVGRLLEKIDDLGLRDNTIVVFSSDHGAAENAVTRNQSDERRLNMLGYNGGLKGGKHTMYDGGVRVPFIIRWPGHVAANQVNSASVISAIDWLPTLCSIIGARIDGGDFDGEDVSGVWLGKDRERTRPLLWKRNNVRSEMAIRDGPWKFYLPGRRNGETELYDLAADPRETTNLAAKQPAVVKRLTAIIGNWNATLPREYDRVNDPD